MKTPGTALCLVCNEIIKYGNSGKKQFHLHVSSMVKIRISSWLDILSIQQVTLLRDSSQSTSNLYQKCQEWPRIHLGAFRPLELPQRFGRGHGFQVFSFLPLPPRFTVNVLLVNVF